MVRERIGMGTLPVEFLLRQLCVPAFLLVRFAVFFALLAFGCGCHCEDQDALVQVEFCCNDLLVLAQRAEGSW